MKAKATFLIALLAIVFVALAFSLAVDAADVECDWKVITIDLLDSFKDTPDFWWAFTPWNMPPESFDFDAKRDAFARGIYGYADTMPVVPVSEVSLADQILTGYCIDVWVLECR